MKMKWFKLKKAEDPREQFVGRTITAYPTAKDAWQRTNPERIQVETIRGNMTHQTMFEINGSHLVSMLDAFCERNGSEKPSQDYHEAFLSTVAECVTPAPKPKEPCLIDRSPDGAA